MLLVPRKHRCGAGRDCGRQDEAMTDQDGRSNHHVVIIGSGFGGLFAAKSLK
jgi:hypothetical protein